MHETLRERLRRKLEALPDEKLYQVLDYIEFLESKYAPGQAPEPTGLQRFAERLEDRLRARAVAPRAMVGTMRLVGSAGRMLDTLAGAGEEVRRGIGTAGERRPLRGGTRAPAPAEGE